MTTDTTWTPDDSQRKVIQVHTGHHLVLAPPGCGKTQILTERIRQAHAQGTDYSDMLCLTFTNRAARGMKERILTNIGDDDVDNVYVGNVHRFCSRFLFTNGIIAAESSVLDEDDAVSILARFLNEDEYAVITNYHRRREYAGVFHLANFMSQIRRRHDKAVRTHPECISREDVGTMRRICEVQHMTFDADAMTDIYDHADYYIDVVRSEHFDYGQQQLGARLLRRMSLARQYEEYKRENRLLDFNDLLIITYDTLLHDDERQYHRYAWIQVDEVQDLNPLQMSIIDLLTADPLDTVMYLGDEQQAIFSFMGAKMDTLTMLRQRCGKNLHHLQVNHRSPKYLLDVFNTYAAEVLHIDPTLLPTTTHEAVRQGNELSILYSDTPDSEVRDVAQFAGQLYANYPGEATAIIVSSNRDAEDISAELTAQHLKHFKVSGSDLFAQTEVKLLLAHLGVLASECNFMAWARILKGVKAVHENASARKMVRDLLDRAVSPADLLRYDGSDTYVQSFVRTYDEQELIVFDTETTGLDVFHDDIVQIAAVKMRQGKIVEGSALSLYIDTKREIPAFLGDIPNPIIEERKHHRLLAPAEALRQFMEYASSGILLGHNADYDYNILDHNLRRYCPDINLKKLHPHYFDSLRLVRLLEPELKQHKLKYLLTALGLEGSNTHLADDDVYATCSVVRHCHDKGEGIIASQREYLSSPNVKHRVETFRRNYGECYAEGIARLYRQEGMANGRPVLVDELLGFYRRLVDEGTICEVENIGYIADYLSQDLIHGEDEPSLHTQIDRHLMEINTLKEADLCNSQSIDDRIFVTTIHKAKGLEFDNVIIFDAVEGRIPNYYSRNDERLLAEDARKFYVAMTRAKRRLYVSQCLLRVDTYNRQHDVHLTPFMNHLLKFFNTCRYDCIKTNGVR